MKKLITPLDIILTVSVIAICALLLFFSKNSSAPVAVITVDGKEIERISLDRVATSYELELPCEPKATLLVEPGAVSFCEAHCRDKLCIGFGKLTHRGDTAACLPAKAVVSVVGGEKSEVDTIT